MAMVAKQGWHIMMNPGTLVARIFKARYFPHSSFLEANVGNNPSYVWRCLWKSRCVLNLGCRWRIGELDVDGELGMEAHKYFHFRRFP
jgi:hypothetical protein